MGTESLGVQMSETEIAQFLARKGHGVLTFSGEKPYGVPISFGYDPTDNRLFFQFISAPDSEKRARLEEDDAVSLVAYERESVDDWWSVVLEGRLRHIEPESTAATAAAEVFAEYGSVVGLTVFDEPLQDLEAEWWEMQVDAMQGYAAPTVD